MSITTAIENISNHLKNAYDELQGLGADLTNVNKNIENISVVLDDIYDSMPQVSGEGTSLTLDNTRVGKIKSTLKGNTSQTGTPTPEAPQDIHVVSRDNFVTINGLNCLNNNKIVKGRLDNGVIGYESGTTLLEVTDNSIEFTTNTNFRGVVTDFIRLQTDNPYIIFGWESATTTPIVSCYYYDKDKNYLSESSGAIYTNLLRYSNTITNARYVRFYISLNNAGTQTISKPQVRFIDGSTQPTYEPYQSQSYSINLGDIELCKIDAYQDRIYKSLVDGNWYVHKEIGKVALDGTGYWGTASEGDTTNGFSIYTTTINNILSEISKVLFCDMFKYIPRNDLTSSSINFVLSGSGNVVILNIDRTLLSEETTTGFKSWLNTNQPLLYYPLQTPTETQITDTTLISQLEALKTAKSYDNQTNISQTNDDLPFILNVSALKKNSSN